MKANITHWTFKFLNAKKERRPLCFVYSVQLFWRKAWNWYIKVLCCFHHLIASHFYLHFGTQHASGLRRPSSLLLFEIKTQWQEAGGSDVQINPHFVIPLFFKSTQGTNCLVAGCSLMVDNIIGVVQSPRWLVPSKIQRFFGTVWQWGPVCSEGGDVGFLESIVAWRCGTQRQQWRELQRKTCLAVILQNIPFSSLLLDLTCKFESLRKWFIYYANVSK